VSIVVITGGLLFVTRAYSAAQHALTRSRDISIAGFLLEEKAFELDEKGALAVSSIEGEFAGRQGYSWKIDAVPIEGTMLNAVTLEVSRQGARGWSYSISTYLNAVQETQDE